MFDTEKGKVQSKYQYLGFGLWENTDPDPIPKPPKVRPLAFREPSPDFTEEEEEDESPRQRWARVRLDGGEGG